MKLPSRSDADKFSGGAVLQRGEAADGLTANKVRQAVSVAGGLAAIH